MKLGPRVAVVTTLLMALVLACVTWVVLLIARGDQVARLERETHTVATGLILGLEPLTPSEAHAQVEARISAAAGRLGPFSIEAVAWASQRPNNFWAGLVEQATKLDAPVGQLFEPEGRAPFYAMAIPLHSAAPGTPARQLVAFVGVVRDCGFVAQESRAAARRLLPFLVGAVLAFGIMVYFIIGRRVVGPLRRLVEGIDDVAQGDLSRAVLPERDDEIGTLAGRFNAMTNHLRQAREQEAHATASRQAMESHLRRAEKLAAVGQLAAEIAHEVGTPLNVIGGRARSLAKRPADTADVQKNAEIISTQVGRIAKIIRQVLDSSRKNRPSVGEADVLKVVREALEFVDEIVKRQHVQVEVRSHADVRPVAGDADEIQQVCLNIVMNALHAMPNGGALTVELEPVVRRKEGLALSAPSSYLMLQITDTGPGVPAADRERIFDAFFTTKDAEKGSGLGLAVSKGIVKDHDGWIEVGDGPQGGAVFRVFLPAAPANERAQADKGETPAPETTA